MLTPFPELLMFEFFAPTLLRIAVAGAFAYLAYTAWTNKEKIAHTELPLIGKQPWAATLNVGILGILAAMLFVGYYTQVAALLGAIASIKGVVFKLRYPNVFPFSRSTYLLIAMVCASLLLTGAGALAFDLPL